MCIATKFQGDANAADLGPHFESHCSNMLSTSLTCSISSFFSVNVIRWLDLFLDSTKNSKKEIACDVEYRYSGC